MVLHVSMTGLGKPVLVPYLDETSPRKRKNVMEAIHAHIGGNMVTLRGSYTAMVTPFRDGRIDEAKIREMVEFQVLNGTAGLIPCGTTGESPTLSHEEHRRVIKIVIDAVRSRVQVIAGTGSNNTTEAISLTEHALKVGVDAARFFFVMRRQESHLDFDLDLAKEQSQEKKSKYVT